MKLYFLSLFTVFLLTEWSFSAEIHVKCPISTPQQLLKMLFVPDVTDDQMQNLYPGLGHPHFLDDGSLWRLNIVRGKNEVRLNDNKYEIYPSPDFDEIKSNNFFKYIKYISEQRVRSITDCLLEGSLYPPEYQAEDGSFLIRYEVVPLNLYIWRAQYNLRLELNDKNSKQVIARISHSGLPLSNIFDKGWPALSFLFQLTPLTKDEKSALWQEACLTMMKMSPPMGFRDYLPQRANKKRRIPEGMPAAEDLYQDWLREANDLEEKAKKIWGQAKQLRAKASQLHLLADQPSSAIGQSNSDSDEDSGMGCVLC